MLNYLFADSVYAALHQFVSDYKVHPILINFTAALIPVSVGSDILATIFDKQTLRDTAWWTLCFAAIITPFTAAAGWLFWMEDDAGVAAMTIHKWLGTTLAVFLVGLVLWRWWFFKSNSRPSVFYLLVALLVVGAVVYQGYLGGNQTFSMFGALGTPSSIAHNPIGRDMNSLIYFHLPQDRFGVNPIDFQDALFTGGRTDGK